MRLVSKMAMCLAVSLSYLVATTQGQNCPAVQVFGFEDCSDKKKSIIFVGNPGVGKSALLNGYIGREVYFKSGVSPGRGLTSALDKFIDPSGVMFFDTPGLSDNAMRAKAAISIRDGLRTSGLFKVVFVTTLESGRVRPQDVTTAKMVLESAPDIKPHQFALVINKVSKVVMNMTQGEKDVIVSTFMKPLAVSTEHILWIPRISSLDDVNTAQWLLHSDFPPAVAFLNKVAPVIEIFPKRVSDIADDYETQVENMEFALQVANEEFEQRLEEQRQKNDKLQCETNEALAGLRSANEKIGYLQKQEAFYAEQVGKLQTTEEERTYYRQQVQDLQAKVEAIQNQDRTPDYQRMGADCWVDCGHRLAGKCQTGWCGKKGYCCRWGWGYRGDGCRFAGCDGYHCCSAEGTDR